MRSLPFLFTHTGSGVIASLNTKMVTNRRRHPRSPPQPPDPRRMTRVTTSSRLVALMCVAEILCMAGFATYPALLPVLRSGWGLSNAAAGLVGGILFFGYVGSVPVLTSLTDRIDARRIYLGSCLLAAGGSAAFALFADGFIGAMIAQALFGVGFAGIYMPGLKAMSDRIDEGLQSRATALYTSLSGFGLAGSYFLAGFVSAHASWRLAFAFATLGPLFAALLVFLLMAPKAPAPAANRPGFYRELPRWSSATSRRSATSAVMSRIAGSFTVRAPGWSRS